MKPSDFRTQFDAMWNNDAISKETSIGAHPEELVTRQELAEDADVNVIMRRFGVGAAFPAAPHEFGERDFDFTLEQGVSALKAADAAWLKLPEAIRLEYGSWEAVFAAVAAGTLSKEKFAPPKPVSAADIHPPDGPSGGAQAT